MLNANCKAAEIQSPRGRRGSPSQRPSAPRPHGGVQGPQSVQRSPGSRALSPVARLCRLSNGQPPLIPALLFFQIKFQLFVNLCENDKPVPELSFNTQKHK